MTKLKPCPFCGGIKLIHSDNGVFCKNTLCEAGVDFGHCVGANKKESQQCKEAVSKAWNRRVDK